MRSCINADGQWRKLMDTARFGGAPDGGICPLALSPEDGQLRD